MAKKKVGKPKKSGHSVAMTVLASVILTMIIVALVNVGLSIFLEQPEYDDYCEYRGPKQIDTESECAASGGRWTDYGVREPVPNGELTGYCDYDYECRMELEAAQESYNQLRYYVFAILGLALFFVGGYAALSTIQYTGFAAGGILLLEGIVTNFENKTLVFVSLIIILAVFSFLVYKKVEKK